MLHHRPLVVCLTYLSSVLAPPGASSSFFGVISIPTAYFPYALVGMELLMGGAAAAARAVAGCIVGHLWWLSAFGEGGGDGLLGQLTRAPEWVRLLVADGPGDAPPPPPPPRAGRGESLGGGVTVMQNRVNARAGGSGASSTGYQWGSGQRLGSD